MLSDIKDEVEFQINEWEVVVDEDVLEALYADFTKHHRRDTPQQLFVWASNNMPNPLRDGYDTPEFNAREAFYLAVIEVAYREEV